MKATGIVRRIDDLGRVVIPKEIRRTMRIHEGAPLEIYTGKDGEVIFKKYSPIGELASFASQYVETLYKTCQMAVIVTDRDSVIASAGISRREYLDRKLSEDFENIIEGRAMYSHKQGAPEISIVEGGASLIKYAMPIISDGDIVGCIASVYTGNDQGENPTEAKLIQTAGAFLGRQFEG
ncbi:MAG: AbrB/MazE/SpoVT family DNA-binding domain-containing protein [Clostridia bacterium]|nr:AbrB/MazE/SpoVT family DNA-binding domain-containing protein [Clostridia bacterium]MBR2296284.1 AbrB/MazE/SpoVT family DNA-binding domain-containing protein [Clostridia bacterium]